MSSTYKYINFNSGILDNVIDAVYVITLEKSHRLKSVYKQINNLKLCKRNIIQINKKYKDYYISELYKQNSAYHLYYNTIQILKDANNKNYNNILILEDDFIFTKYIKNKNVIKDLEKFTKTIDFNLLYLGCKPLYVLPSTNYKFLYLLWGSQTHSTIYSRKSRNFLLNYYNIKKKVCFGFHDIHYNVILNKKYFYYKSLCYQLSENTENRKLWNTLIHDICIYIFKLDKKKNNGINHFYLFIYILHIIILFIIIKYIFYNVII
jgi:hypothetical protein